MTIYELYNVNNDWNRCTFLTIKNRDGSLYKTSMVEDLLHEDLELQVINFEDDTITVVRKPLRDRRLRNGNND